MCSVTYMHIGLSHKKIVICDVLDVVSKFDKQTLIEIVKIIQDRVRNFSSDIKMRSS